MSHFDPPIRTPPIQPRRSATRGCLWGFVAAAFVPALSIVFCCGALHWTEQTWGTYHFQCGLRITGPARRAYRDAAAAHPGYFLRVSDSGARYYAAFTDRMPPEGTKTFSEQGITVVVDECICQSPQWQYLKPTIAQRGPDNTQGYVFGFAGADPPSGFPSVGRP